MRRIIQTFRSFFGSVRYLGGFLFALVVSAPTHWDTTKEYWEREMSLTLPGLVAKDFYIAALCLVVASLAWRLSGYELPKVTVCRSYVFSSKKFRLKIKNDSLREIRGLQCQLTDIEGLPDDVKQNIDFPVLLETRPRADERELTDAQFMGNPSTSPSHRFDLAPEEEQDIYIAELQKTFPKIFIYTVNWSVISLQVGEQPLRFFIELLGAGPRVRVCVELSRNNNQWSTRIRGG